jgi:uncharacterized membrane protein YfcA
LENLEWFIALALLAEILGTVGGFGSSLFFVPVASYFLDFYSVLGITAAFHVTSNLTKIAFFRKGFDRRLALMIGIPALIFVVAGAVLSRYIDAHILEIALACFLVVLSLVFLSFRQIVVRPDMKNSVIGGALSGFLAGLLGTGGAVRGITLAAFNLKMEVFIATSAVIDLVIDASRTVVYGMNGYIHRHDLYLIPILLVVSVVGTFIGKILLKRISEERFKTIVLLLVLFTGLFTLYKVWSHW